MSWFGGPGRGRAFIRLVIAVVWTIAAYVLSERAADTLTEGVAFPLIRDLFALLLFLVGYSYMAMAWDRVRDPLRTIGFVLRPGAAREFGLGAALGWGMVVVFFLVIVGVGQFYIRLSSSPAAWGMLVLEICTLAAGALAAETAFRGYPFQKLIETTGPFAATILVGLFFGILEVESSVAVPAAAAWVNGIAAVMLAIAYLRTRALWLCWGLHFTWLASIGILFGQPLAGSRQTPSVIQTFADGPTWLTGSEYGPQGSAVAVVILWIGLFLLFIFTRDLARKYARPQVRLAPFPGDIRSFAAPPAGAIRVKQPESGQPESPREVPGTLDQPPVSESEAAVSQPVVRESAVAEPIPGESAPASGSRGPSDLPPSR